MAQTEAALCSAALNLLGDDSIVNLTDDSDRARLCNRLYEIERDATLRAHRWNSAITRVALAELAAAPIHGWAKAFQLPSDPFCLRAISINEGQAPNATATDQIDDPGDPFSVEGRRLLTNAGTANLRYIARITDPAVFDALLYDTIIARMAWRMAFHITGLRTFADDMKKQYDQILTEARAMDAQEGTPDPLVSDDLILARR